LDTILDLQTGVTCNFFRNNIIYSYFYNINNQLVNQNNLNCLKLVQDKITITPDTISSQPTTTEDHTMLTDIDTIPTIIEDIDKKCNKIQVKILISLIYHLPNNKPS
jgi:hypothetical protein